MGPASLPVDPESPPEPLPEAEPSAPPPLLEPVEPSPPAAASGLPAEGWLLLPQAHACVQDVPTRAHATNLEWIAIADLLRMLDPARMARMTDAIEVDLREAPVLDPEGRAVPLASLWSDRTVVLSFVRHFG